MYRTFNNSNYSINEKTDEELDREKLNDPKYCKNIGSQLIDDDKLIHMLKHFNVIRLDILVNHYMFSIQIKIHPIKKNIECGYCKDIKSIAEKYQMVHNFLKTKIGPDCSRLVVYETFKSDMEDDCDIERQIKNIIFEYIKNKPEFIKINENHQNVRFNKLEVIAIMKGKIIQIPLPY